MRDDTHEAASGAVTLHRSQGKRRPQAPRPDELPPLVVSDDTAPERDPNTGKFVAGNQASRRRKARALARAEIAGLDPNKCVGWLRPFAELAIRHAQDLVADMVVQTPALRALAVDLATSTAVYRALLALGAEGDMKALGEARAWLRESRQGLLTLTGESREEAAARRVRSRPSRIREAQLAAAKAEEKSE